MPVVRRTAAEAAERRQTSQTQDARTNHSQPQNNPRASMDQFADSIFSSTIERGYRGTMYEADALGVMKKTDAYEKAYQKLTGKNSKDLNGYFGNIDAMMQIVRDNYTLDPLRPIKPIAKELRQEIVRRLNLSAEEQKRFKFYTAVQSGFLDSKHHIDGWFQYENEDGEVRWVGVDVSMREEGDKKGAKTGIEVNRVPVDPETIEEQKAFRYLIEQKFAPRFVREFAAAVDHDRTNHIRKAA